MKLANRKTAIPNGFLFEQTHTGWKNWVSSPNSVWDFELLCQDLLAHRQANRAQFPFLSLDINKIRDDVDFVNALRISKMAGTESYIDQSGGSPANFQNPPSRLLARAAGDAVKLAKGAGLLLDWLGSGAKPVDPGLANSRASICSKCPENGDGNLSRVFTVPLSNMIRRQLASKKELNLSTPFDDQIGICNVCLCPLPLKVHVGISFVREHLPASVEKELPEWCWLKTEAQ